MRIYIMYILYMKNNQLKMNDEMYIDWHQFERDILLQALNQAANNKTLAAKLLGLSYKAFLYRLEKHQI